jgi:hypothetical protein
MIANDVSVASSVGVMNKKSFIVLAAGNGFLSSQI